MFQEKFYKSSQLKFILPFTRKTKVEISTRNSRSRMGIFQPFFQGEIFSQIPQDKVKFVKLNIRSPVWLFFGTSNGKMISQQGKKCFNCTGKNLFPSKQNAPENYQLKDITNVLTLAIILRISKYESSIILKNLTFGKNRQKLAIFDKFRTIIPKHKMKIFMMHCRLGKNSEFE